LPGTGLRYTHWAEWGVLVSHREQRVLAQWALGAARRRHEQGDVQVPGSKPADVRLPHMARLLPLAVGPAVAVADVPHQRTIHRIRDIREVHPAGGIPRQPFTRDQHLSHILLQLSGAFIPDAKRN
jgi:hypothetical protein